MSADTTPDTTPDAPDAPEAEAPETTAADVEKQAFLDRLKKEGSKRKEAEARATELEKRLADLEAAAQERENAGLPELERERKARERVEAQLADAAKRAEAAEQTVQRAQKERLVLAAAQAANFADPSDASAFLNLDEIEDERDAERAVKSLAKRKGHLLKSDGPVLPGKVLDGGSTTTANGKTRVDPRERDAETVRDSLMDFLKSRGY